MENGEDAPRSTGGIDHERLEKLKQIVRVSERLKVSRMAEVLEIDEQELWKRVFAWAEQFGFTIDDDVVKFQGGQKEDFISKLEQEFEPQLETPQLEEPPSVRTPKRHISLKQILQKKGKLAILGGIVAIIGLNLPWFKEINPRWGVPYYASGMGAFYAEGNLPSSLNGLVTGGNVMLLGAIIAIVGGGILFTNFSKYKLPIVGRLTILAGATIVLIGYVLYLVAGSPLFPGIYPDSFFTEFSAEIGFYITTCDMALIFIGGIVKF